MIASIRSVPSPIAAASALTDPARTDRIEDPVVSRLQAGRTVLGLLATAGLLMVYPLKKGREEFVLGKLEDLVLGCAILLVAVAVGVTAFILSARSPLGRVYARRLGGPLRALGAILLGVAVCWLMVAALSGDIVSTADVGSHDFLFGFLGEAAGRIITGLLIALLFIAAGIACAVVLVLAVCFTLVAAIKGLNSCFRTGDVHELLPALLSPLLVWSLFVLGLLDDPDVAAPPAVLYSFLLGGPLSVTALSVWEMRRLRVRHGVTMRSALGR
ncbi:hypothetical protein [Streptomyces griseocarneus]|uniref:hypothetical protein n=1 Tax=Streptomyces griseocarneus TaxID=51201 RepID=UPI00167E81FF|nr:hypothetical protein [Streptomyces griseocarneus]MBZ6477927.1 hypothetical protein [Streptomyces griseocarneus]GHG54209.1 hypothetical protein GCM10018779_16960 [Streptomyces griseocarneus]